MDKQERRTAGTREKEPSWLENFTGEQRWLRTKTSWTQPPHWAAWQIWGPP